ncbi:MAG TPA: DinB family protein [Candidatus Limnocylindria bacterium]|nr:DinB family protein [Candidatus Limnocylindria bacterium]
MLEPMTTMGDARMKATFTPVAGSMQGDAVAHHLWATDRLLEFCERLTDEQLRQHAAGTYGSIIDTLRHVVGSDRWYLTFFSTSASPLPAIDESNGATLAQLRTETERNAAAWTEVLAGDPDPERDVAEMDPRWEFHVPLGFRLAQATHHGTDHRSQVCTALSTLGIEPPEIDVWAYGDAIGRTRFVELAASS